MNSKNHFKPAARPDFLRARLVLPWLGLPLCLMGGLLPLPAQETASPPVTGQNAAGTEAAPAAAEPTRAEVEQYIPELRDFINSREVRMTRLVNEITALDQSIQQAVTKVLAILTPARDSVQTRTRIANLKQETIAGLKRAAEAYAQKRNLIASELGTTKNEFRQEELFQSRGQIDTRIDNMVAAMVQLAQSMETDEGHERFVRDYSISVSGRRGISVPATVRNPDFEQNRRQAAQTEKTMTELDNAFQESMKRLEGQERAILTHLAVPTISEPDKARLTAELERVKAIREERIRQRAQLDRGVDAPGNTLGRRQVVETEELVGSIIEGGRRDFARMMTSFNELRRERQAIVTFRERLDHAEQWLKSHPETKSNP